MNSSYTFITRLQHLLFMSEKEKYYHYNLGYTDCLLSLGEMSHGHTIKKDCSKLIFYI